MSNSSGNIYVEKVEHISEIYIQPVLLGVGMITNGASVLLLRSERDNDAVMHGCLVWLAASDLCATVTGFVHIFLEGQLLNGMVDFGHWSMVALSNYVFYFLFLMFLGMSSMIVVLIAIFRCVLIKWPLKFRAWLTPNRVQSFIQVGCAATFLMFLPTSLTAIWQLCFDETEVRGCVSIIHSLPGLGTASKKYLYSLGVLYIPVPVLIYIICFIIIRRSLSTSVTGLRGLRDSGAEIAALRQRSFRQVTRLLLSILVLDTLCTLPTVVSSVALVISSELLYHKDTNPEFHIFDSLGEILLLLRPTYNFWLYVFVRPQFRGKLLAPLRRICGFRTKDFKSQISVTALPIINNTQDAVEVFQTDLDKYA